MRLEVITVLSDGLVLRSAGSDSGPTEYWMSWSDWSDNEGENTRAFDEVCAGDKVDVLPLPGRHDVRGRTIVSRRLFGLRDVDSTWRDEPRTMVIQSISRELIRGRIGSVPAVMYQTAYEEYVEALAPREYDATEEDGAAEKDGILERATENHLVLTKGDRVSGVVVALETKYGDVDLEAVELDPVRYLKLRNEQIQAAVAAAVPVAKSEAGPGHLEPLTLSASLAERLSPLLLVENDESFRTSLEGFLRRSNVEVLAAPDAAAACKHVAELDPARTISFAVVDANLNEAENDKAGVALLRELAPRLSCPVMLISAEDMPSKEAVAGDLMLNSVLEKPFSMREFRANLRAALVSAKRSLADWLSIERLGDTSAQVERTPNLQTSSFPSHKECLTKALQGITDLRPGAVVHVFKVHPRSFRATSIAHVGEGLRWQPLRGKVEKSRIKDVAVGNAPIFEETSANPALHFWTEQMMPYASFCGLPLDLPHSPYRYVLAAFFKVHTGFGHAFELQMRLCAERVGRILERGEFQRSAESDEHSKVMGVSLSCVAHELYNHLETISSETAHMGSLLGDASAPAETARLRSRFGLLSRSVDEAIDITKMLRGHRIRTESVAILTCLRRAIIGCRSAASDLFDEPNDVRIDLPDQSFPPEARVVATRGALTIAFFNILLNSLQQIRLINWLRQKGHIWTTWERRTDAHNAKWLYVFIHDTAQGIHEDDVDRVFLSGYSTRPYGTGLGLGICRTLLQSVTADGRTAEIRFTRSVIWDGTTCLIKLPLAQ